MTKTFRDFESFGVHYLKEVAQWRPKTVERMVSDLPRRPQIECTLGYDRARTQGKETNLGYRFIVSRAPKAKGRKPYSIQTYARSLPAKDGILRMPLSQGLTLLGLSLAA